MRHPFWKEIPNEQWTDWRWQMRHCLRTLSQFENIFNLAPSERAAFERNSVEPLFQIRVTPYYASLAANDSLRRIFMPTVAEFEPGVQGQLDPLGEVKNTTTPRLVHRYSDRVLFLVTDVCSVYCRFCTRKHFTGQDEAKMPDADYASALEYIRAHPGVREVILSGGDPLTLSDETLRGILCDLRKIPHVELIRIGSRMPIVNPFRVTKELVQALRAPNDEMSGEAPVFFMSHFNHPAELTLEARRALTFLVDGGIPVMNQMVLLNGVNNHAAIVQALSRRLLNLRVKPYYMFQCDPSLGTDHLRTSVENSLEIQRELWGHLSGLAMPTLALDIPSGGGKAVMVPNFQTAVEGPTRSFVGWDGVHAEYVSPNTSRIVAPSDVTTYASEWESLRTSKTENRT